MLAWILFLTLILCLLALDLGVFHRKASVVSVRQAFAWSAFWICLGISFTAVIYFSYEHHWLGLGTNEPGRPAAVKYLTGYLVEKSLSVDNIFVISLVFTSLGIPAKHQHRVLYWGILGALIMRGIMIGCGTLLIERFHWLLYVFGVFLIITAIRMILQKEEETDPGDHWLTKKIRHIFPVTTELHEQHFVVKIQPCEKLSHPTKSVWALTPLAVALIIVEFTDLIFAVDSIPAIFAITTDPFLIFTSNVFAILGLRSLYFALAGMIDHFKHLKPALSLILFLIGVKMLGEHWFHAWLDDYYNLVVLSIIALILTTAVVTSLVASRKSPPKT